MTTVYNFELEEGSEKTVDLIYEDEAGNPHDLTGFAAKLSIKKLVSDADPIATITNVVGADGEITLGDAAGTVSLRFDDSALTRERFVGQSYVYDLFLTPPAGSRFKLVKGAITFQRSITAP